MTPCFFYSQWWSHVGRTHMQSFRCVIVPLQHRWLLLSLCNIVTYASVLKTQIPHFILCIVHCWNCIWRGVVDFLHTLFMHFYVLNMHQSSMPGVSNRFSFRNHFDKHQCDRELLSYLSILLIGLEIHTNSTVQTFIWSVIWIWATCWRPLVYAVELLHQNDEV